jgi:hypothetical protein
VHGYRPARVTPSISSSRVRGSPATAGKNRPRRHCTSPTLPGPWAQTSRRDPGASRNRSGTSYGCPEESQATGGYDVNWSKRGAGRLGERAARCRPPPSWSFRCVHRRLHVRRASPRPSFAATARRQER